MCIHDASEIGCIGSEPDSLDPPVEHDVMKQHIADPVEGDTDGYGSEIKNARDIAGEEKGYGYAAEKNRKQIVFLESVSPGPVMIFVKDPEKAVHYVAVGKPGHKFHKTGKEDNDDRVYDNIESHDLFSIDSDRSFSCQYF